MNAKASANKRGVLVVYYSLSGNTARVARDLAKRTKADIESLRDTSHGKGFIGYWKSIIDAVRGKPVSLDNLKYDPADYSLVVIGTPVWAWHMTPAIRAYLMMFAGDLGNVGFFVTSGDTDVEKLVPSMEAIIRRNAVASAGFNAKELAVSATYESKLTDFIQALNRAPGWVDQTAASPA